MIPTETPRLPDGTPSSRKIPMGLLTILIIIKNVSLILIGSYGLSVSLHIVLRSLIPDGSTTIAFFNTFAHLMWMPALILLPIMLIVRQQRVALTLLMPTMFLLSHYSYVVLPKAEINLAANATRITLQTQNILANNRSPERIIDIINDIDADIVALQEVSTGLVRYLDTLEQYPYRAVHAKFSSNIYKTRETMGQAILSRYPILEDDYWSYDFLHLPLGHQRVVLDIDGQEIVVYNIHPTHPGMTDGAFFSTSERRLEFEDLLARIQTETRPLILLGDLNLNDLNYEYSLLSAHLTDTYRTVGNDLGYTFPDFSDTAISDSMQIVPDIVPDDLPIPLFLRLDYVFHSEEFRGVSAYVYHSSGGSDHRPLVVELGLDTTD